MEISIQDSSKVVGLRVRVCFDTLVGFDMMDSSSKEYPMERASVVIQMKNFQLLSLIHI